MAAYRDNLLAARCRLEQVQGSGGEPVFPRTLVDLYGYRQARLWAGVVAIAGFVVMLLDIVGEGGEHAAHLLLATWGASAAVFVLVLPLARLYLDRRSKHSMAPSGDVFVDLARIETGQAVQTALCRVHRLERASFAVPLAAFSLLMPLSLHLLFGVLVLEVDLESFGRWIVASLVLVGHAHLTLLVLSILHVVRAGRELDWSLPVPGAARGFKALLWTTLVSGVPGIYLLCVPPALVFITGLVFVPWVFGWATGRARLERGQLEACGLSFEGEKGPEGPAPR